MTGGRHRARSRRNVLVWRPRVFLCWEVKGFVIILHNKAWMINTRVIVRLGNKPTVREETDDADDVWFLFQWTPVDETVLWTSQRWAERVWCGPPRVRPLPLACWSVEERAAGKSTFTSTVGGLYALVGLVKACLLSDEWEWLVWYREVRLTLVGSTEDITNKSDYGQIRFQTKTNVEVKLSKYSKSGGKRGNL